MAKTKVDKRFTKKRDAGRPVGSTTPGFKYSLSEYVNHRATEGYVKALDLLERITGKKKNVIRHEAMRDYLLKHIIDTEGIEISKQIL